MPRTTPNQWHALNREVPKMSEQELWELLEKEKAAKARPTYLVRIHQRASTLRAKRERAELIGEQT